MILHIILFVWFLDLFAILLFSIWNFSSGGCHLAGQVTEASLRRNDNLVALCFLLVFLFSLLDQFSIGLVLNYFKCWKIINYFNNCIFFQEVLWKAYSLVHLLPFISYLLIWRVASISSIVSCFSYSTTFDNSSRQDSLPRVDK